MLEINVHVISNKERSF